MSRIVLKGWVAACAVALGGCTGHPVVDHLPKNLAYDLVIQPAGAAEERSTRASFGTTDIEAAAGFAQVRLVSRLPEQVTFEYRCHVHGVDAIPQWVADGQPCAAASASYVQGIQVRLAGPAAKHYRVRYECHTTGTDSRGIAQPRGSTPAQAWCGARESSTGERITRLVVFVEPVLT
jgi:hypothetical protein